MASSQSSSGLLASMKRQMKSLRSNSSYDKRLEEYDKEKDRILKVQEKLLVENALTMEERTWFAENYGTLEMLRFQVQDGLADGLKKDKIKFLLNTYGSKLKDVDRWSQNTSSKAVQRQFKGENVQDVLLKSPDKETTQYIHHQMVNRFELPAQLQTAPDLASPGTPEACDGMLLFRQRVSNIAVHDSGIRRPRPAPCDIRARERVLLEVAHWIKDVNRRNSVHWLSGGRGAGKTAIMQYVATRCARAKGLAAGYFLTQHDCNRIRESFIPTLAHEIARYIPEFEGHLHEFCANNSWIFTRTVETQLEELVFRIWQRLNPESKRPLLFIIDGIDRCQWAMGSTIFESMIQCTTKLPICFLISSSPENWILNELDKSLLNSITVHTEVVELSVAQKLALKKRP